MLRGIVRFSSIEAKTFPAAVPEIARQLINELLQTDPTQRLGGPKQNAAEKMEINPKQTSGGEEGGGGGGRGGGEGDSYDEGRGDNSSERAGDDSLLGKRETSGEEEGGVDAVLRHAFFDGLGDQAS